MVDVTHHRGEFAFAARRSARARKPCALARLTPPSAAMGSFRQLLLVAFLLIAALLGGTALRAVVILDRLMAQSSEAAGRRWP